MTEKYFLGTKFHWRMSMENDMRYFNQCYHLQVSEPKSRKMVYIKHYMNGPRIHIVHYERKYHDWCKTGEMFLTMTEYNVLVNLAPQINKDSVQLEPDYETIPIRRPLPPIPVIISRKSTENSSKC